MILEEETFKRFDYYPKDLKKYSKRKILVECDECSEVREIRYDHYVRLCKSCTQKRIHPSLETKKKMSASQTGEKHSQYGIHRSEETKKKIGNGNRGKTFSEKTKQKMRENALKMPEETKQKISKTLIIYFSDSKNHPCYGKVGKDSSAWKRWNIV